MTKFIERQYPYCHVGQIVLWHTDGNRKYPPSPAVIEAIVEKGVDLVLFAEGNVKKECVRHVDDKTATITHFQESGGWQHTPTTNMMFRLAPEFADWHDGPPKEEPKKKTAAA